MPLKAGHHWPDSETNNWRAEDGPTLSVGLFFQGIRTSIAKKPIIFVIIHGGPDPLHHLWIRACHDIQCRPGVNLHCASVY